MAQEASAIWYFMLDQIWPLLASSNPEYSAQVTLWPSDSHRLSWVPEAERLDEPVLCAGYWFTIVKDRMPAWLDDKSVCEELTRLSALVGRHPNGRQGRCEALLYLSDVVSHGRTLRDQASYAASWVVASLKGISAIGASS